MCVVRDDSGGEERPLHAALLAEENRYENRKDGTNAAFATLVAMLRDRGMEYEQEPFLPAARLCAAGRRVRIHRWVSHSVASLLFPASASLKARDRAFFKGLARAVAGALIFALPMMMTMEMWQLGFYVSPWRLALLIAILVPLLAGLSRVAGFKDSAGLRDDVVDAFVAVAVAVSVAMIVLGLFSVLKPAMSVDEVIGKVAMQAVPGSIGAMLARSQLAAQSEEDEPEAHKHNPGHAGELFQMAVGALFLSLNVAPTEEVVLIAHQMAPWQELGLAAVSLALMHAFVYAIDLRGQHQRQEWESFGSLFLRYTVAGYAIVLVICFYMLWTFGRTDGMPLEVALSATVVLGFPAAIGAAAARLIL